MKYWLASVFCTEALLLLTGHSWRPYIGLGEVQENVPARISSLWIVWKTWRDMDKDEAMVHKEKHHFNDHASWHDRDRHGERSWC